MLKHSRVLPIAVAKRTSQTYSSFTIQHLLTFSSITTPNVHISKYKDTNHKYLNKNVNLKSLSAYNFIKSTVLSNLKIDSEQPVEEQIFKKNKPNISEIKQFKNIEFLLNLFQQSLNNKIITIADLSKDTKFQSLVDSIKNSNSVVISMVMKKLNFNRISNLLVEDLISVDLIIAVLKQLNCNESISLFVKLAAEKCRPTSILVSLCENIVKGKKSEFTLKQSSEVLHSMSVLSFYDDNLLKCLMTTLPKVINTYTDISDFTVILKSLSSLRIRNEDVLNEISSCIFKNRENIKSHDVCSLLMTCAVLGYTPKNFIEIYEQIVTPLIESESLSTFELLDVVWALTILEKVKVKHLQFVLNSNFFQKEDFSAFPSKILKILNINAAATFNVPNYEGPVLPTDSLLFKPEIILSKERIRTSSPIIKALKLLLPADSTYMNTYVNKNIGYILDAEFCVDNNCTPVPINVNISTKKKVNRIGILSVTYTEMCYGLNEVMGRIKFYSKLLEKMGYKVLLLPYKKDCSNQSPIVKAKYINEQLKSLLLNN